VEKLAYKPGYWFVKEFIYPKYADSSNALKGVKRAFAPDFAVPGGILDESMYAWLIYSKFGLHLPHYRLEEMMRSAGIELSRQTLSSGCVKAAEALRPLYELIRQEIIKRGIIFADETPVKMLDPGAGKTKKTYIWVYACKGGLMEVPCPECDGDGWFIEPGPDKTSSCTNCQGDGDIDPESCSVCNGKKVITCPYCNGTGEIPDKK